jgi:putative N6-adenine-specific DNA methylase
MASSDKVDLFAITAPGLERVVAEELRQLGMGATVVEGGVTFRDTLLGAARANLWLRAASRILLRVGTFDAPGRRELAARLSRFSLDAWVPPQTPIHVHATASRSRLYHTGLIGEIACDALARPAAPKQAAAPTIFLRLERDRCTLSVDTSGDLLHRRGYRTDIARAPLRETLAAGMLLLCGYDGSTAFVDPMCGSGTLPIEAWLLSTKRAPGLQRRFAFESFPELDHAAWDQLREEARAQIRPPQALIEGADIHAGSLAAARRNAERAGAEEVRWERCDVALRGAPAETGLLLVNPPYGRRVADQESGLRALGSAIEGSFARWRAGVLLPKATRLPLHRRSVREIPLDNGGIPVRLLEYGVP